MSHEVAFITEKGLQKAKEELSQLEKIERPEALQSLSTAREWGDLKENSEYKAAKELLHRIDNSIKRLSSIITKSSVMDVSKVDTHCVGFGTSVTLMNLNTGQQAVYSMVCDYESDINANMLSITSPIGKGIINKKQGDLASISTPGGDVLYEILKISQMSI